MKQKSSNPIFKTINEKQTYAHDGAVATRAGIFTKAFSALFVFVAVLVISMMTPAILMFSGSTIGFLTLFIFSMITVVSIAKNPAKAKSMLYIYAAIQGVYLSSFVYILNTITGTNIGAQAGLLVVLIFFMMLVVYGMFPGFYSKIAPFMAIAMFSIMGILVVSMFMSLFGGGIRFASNFDLIITLALTIMASLSYLRDFSNIDRMVNSNAPKHMEYLAAFGLLATTIWLYVELVRLLAILSNRRD